MYCKNCGTEIEEGGKFCPSCGTSVNEENKILSYIKKHKASFSVIIIGLIVGVLAFNLFGTFRNTYETPIQTLMKAIETKDTNEFMKVFPEDFLEYAKTNIRHYGMNFEEFIEKNIEAADVFGNSSDLKLEYTINNIVEYSDLEVQEKIANIKRRTGLLLDIDEAKALELHEITKSGNQRSDDTETIVVIKIKGKWYTDPSPFI